MATFTMLEVLKKQKSYQQALLVLNFLEQKKIDLPRIKKERELNFILSNNLDSAEIMTYIKNLLHGTNCK